MTEMQDNDNELDDLFRKSMANPDIPFSEEAWKAMEAKLDAEDRKRGGYFNIIGGCIAVFMILGGIGLFFIQTKTKKEHTASTEIHTPDKKQTLHAGDAADISENSNTDIKNKGTELQSLKTLDQSSASANESNDKVSSNKPAKIKEQQNNNHADSDKKTKNVTVYSSALMTNKYSQKNTTQRAHNTEKHNSILHKNGVTKNRMRKKNIIEKPAIYKISNAQDNTLYDLALASKKGHASKQIIDTDQKIKTLTHQDTMVFHDADANDLNYSGTESTSENNSMRKSAAIARVTELTSAADSNNTYAGILKNTNRVSRSKANTTDDAYPDAYNTTVPDSTQIYKTNETHLSVSENTYTDDAAINFVSDNNLLNTTHNTDSLLEMIPDSVAQKTDSAKTTEALEKIMAKKELYKKGFSLSLILNPEFNSTTDFSFYKPGINIGLNLEYYIHPRISIITGILYAQKLYTCDGSLYPYSPSYSYHGKNYAPSTIKASCGVLDIPVNIRYKLLNKKSYNIYAVAGLSSYLMLKEKYTFEYTHNHPSSTAEIDNKNRSLFTIANISAGIERRLNSRWSVQAEPYVKIPLNGIGEGNLKVVSTGIFFSVKYYLK